jgi:hypothetical protein
MAKSWLNAWGVPLRVSAARRVPPRGLPFGFPDSPFFQVIFVKVSLLATLKLKVLQPPNPGPLVQPGRVYGNIDQDGKT